MAEKVAIPLPVMAVLVAAEQVDMLVLEVPAVKVELVHTPIRIMVQVEPAGQVVAAEVEAAEV